MKLLGLVAVSLVASATLVPVSMASAAPHHGWRMKTVCKTTWVHHHKVRRCHKVRARW